MSASSPASSARRFESMTRRQSFVLRCRKSGFLRRTSRFVGEPHNLCTRIATTPSVGGLGLSSILPTSLFPSPIISMTLGFRAGVTEKLLLSEVVPELAEVESILSEPLMNARRVAEGTCAAASVRLTAHESYFLWLEVANQVRRVCRHDDLRHGSIAFCSHSLQQADHFHE